MEWEVGGRFKREGTYVYPWLIHVDVWQKPTQHCKAIILQLKINKLKKKNKKKTKAQRGEVTCPRSQSGKWRQHVNPDSESLTTSMSTF